MNKKGFISSALLYSMLILFLFLMLAVINYYDQKNIYMESIDEQIDNDLNKTSNNSIDLYSFIKSQAKNDTIDFSINSKTSNTNGVYITTSTDSGKEVYYYRGNVNNNIVFNNFCWKIIRTTETGGIKLIYNGNVTNGECNASGGNAIQGSTTSYNTSEDAKYKSSSIKTLVDNFYNNVFTEENIKSKIENTVYCNDLITTSISDKIDLGFVSYNLLYGAIDRVSEYTKVPTPTLKCTNDKSTYSVGLITLDEVVFAGFNTFRSNSSDYMDTNNYLYANIGYWTMTPVISDSNEKAYIGTVTKDGWIDSTHVTQERGVRPVISLKSGVTVSGSGTSSNPYIVE